ncbi:aspartic peptidase domain-containing protein [Mycena galopus ATCC 62051]|nr:aspartic peptidase domain-containing protein [Mycena galopus ATCC 62051]
MVQLTAPFLLLACLVSVAIATPPNVLSAPIYKKVWGGTASVKALVARDLRRFNLDVAAFVGEAPATNKDNTYVAATQIGTQTLTSGTKYSPGSTSMNTGATFSVSYGSGAVSSKEYTENLVLGGLTGFTGVDGIIGFGLVDLTEDTISGSTTVPTTVNNLFTQGTISTQVLGVSFSPECGSHACSDSDDDNGELSPGGTDSTKFTVFPQRFRRQDRLLLALRRGLSFPRNENLAFTIDGVSYLLTPAQYTIPTAQYNYWELSTGKFYGWIGAGGTDASEGHNFIIGQRFLDYYYTINRVGFATRAV